jgi:superfamily II DNA or RNA helicase
MASAQDIHLNPEQFEHLEEALKTLPSPIVTRGATLMRERAVRSLSWKLPGVLMEAKVQGTRLYTAQLTFDDDAASTDCTCEYGDDCKHGVALILELRKNAQRTAPPTSVSNQQSKLDPESLAGIVVAQTGKKLSQQAVFFLNKADYLWKTKSRAIDQSQLHEMCGRQSFWGYGKMELYPEELTPKSASEFLVFLAEAVRKCQLIMPEPILAAVDAKLHKSVMAQWQRIKEVNHWRASFEKWQEPSETEAQTVPELRLQLLPSTAIVQVRHPNETEFGKVTQKLLKNYAPRYSQGESKTALSAGSHLVLRAACDEYGTIRGTEIAAMSEALCKSLSQLASSPELFHEHVCSADGEPLLFTDESLHWELKAPTEKSGDYALRLLNEQGLTPAPPVAILRSHPLRYVTSELVYTLPYWPFGKERMNWPVEIPAAAIESREGLAALGKLGLPVPERFADKVKVIKAKVEVRCKVNRPAGSSSDYMQVSAKTSFGNAQTDAEWNGFAWQAQYSQSAQRTETSAEFIQIDKSMVPLCTAWLKQMPMKMAAISGRVLWLEQRIVGKDWPEQFMAWMDRRPKDITVELDEELASLKNGLVSGKVRLDVEESNSGMDWFDLNVALDVTDTTLSPEEITLLLKAKGKWVKLVGKGWRKLEFDLSEDQVRELAELGMAVNDFDGSKQKLHALQLGSLTKNTTLLPAERAMQVQRRIEEIQTRVTPELPSSITATLRPYQLSGFHFLAYLTANRFGGVLADDMGLGKTLQTLAWIAWLRAEQNITEPILVVCPKSVQDNWRAEVERFCPTLRVEVWNRSNAGKTGVKGDADILVIHYPHLRLHEDLLCSLTWGAVILDEAQAIKNPSAQSTKAACALNARHRLALTGTPIENRLLDLWSIFAFAMPGVLGTRAAFGRDFDGKDDPLARRRLAARTRPFLLRRTKSEVASDLPDRVEEDLVIELEGTQAALYLAELKRARAQLLKAEKNQELDKLRFNILTSLLRLRQICCHPRLIGLDKEDTVSKGRKKNAPEGPATESAKVSALMELLEQLTEEGQKVLVFSQFVEMLDIIEDEIATREWRSFKLTGATEDRGALVKAFQTHEGPATFLISLKAGGFGLNLTAASYVVLFDPWWNPAVEAQAIDRTHRIGQKQTVFAYRLLIKDSIEEKIRHLQKQKGSLANDILGEENFAQALTLNDFHFLLGADR